MNLETASKNVGTMDGAMKSAAVPDKQNEAFVEAEVIPKKNKSTEDLDVEASDNPKVNKYQDAIANYDTAGPEDLDADSRFFPEVTEYHEVLGTVYTDEGNTQRTSDYDTTVDLDVANIDKNNKDKRRTIYEAIDGGYLGEFKLFPRAFINISKNLPNKPQNIPTDIKENLK